ncbi:sugar transferase [Glutamicibacter sp. X7]
MRLIYVLDALVICLWLVGASGTAIANAKVAHLAAVAMVALLWIAVLSLKGARQSQILGVGSDEYKRVLEASLLTAGLVAISVLAIGEPLRAQLVLLGVLPGMVTICLERWLLRRILHFRARRGAVLSRVVVVGAANDISYLVRQIRNKSASVYEVVAAVEDTGTSLQLPGVFVSYNFDDLDSLIEAHGADAVMVAGHLQAGSAAVQNLGWDLETTGTELILASSLTNVAGPRIKLRPVEGLPLIHVDPPSFTGTRWWIKRLIDVVLSTVALVVLCPLLGVIAVAVYLDSPGPVIFAQRRVGKAGEDFVMYKFRTMVADAEQRLDELKNFNEGAGPLFKLHQDPRVTRVGTFLRKFSLDELPQIFNVLRGDMSLVGPRPPLRNEVESYEYRTFRRLLIRPGLTGLWQVNGRSDLSWEESVRLDLYYVENWSVLGDVIIMWHTFKAMVRPAGAY